MYTPKYFQCSDNSLVEESVKNYPFGILISKGNNLPFTATHLPFLLEKENEEYRLISHLASMNEQSKLEDGSDVLVVFSGPHDYVSPSNYSSKDQVPTWDYIAVHMHGKIDFIHEEEQKVQILEKTIMHFEQAYMEQWKQVSSRYKESLLKIMTAFRIRVSHVESSFKLSQNKPPQDIEKIIRTFEKTNPALAEEMKRFYGKG